MGWGYIYCFYFRGILKRVWLKGEVKNLGKYCCLLFGIILDEIVGMVEMFLRK